MARLEIKHQAMLSRYSDDELREEYHKASRTSITIRLIEIAMKERKIWDSFKKDYPEMFI